MSFRTAWMAGTVMAMAALGLGCGSACEDMQDCCDALGIQCNYDSAEEETCEAARDAATRSLEGDVPEECDF